MEKSAAFKPELNIAKERIVEYIHQQISLPVDRLLAEELLHEICSTIVTQRCSDRSNCLCSKQAC